MTHYNRLMWDAGRTPTCVVDHGVVVPPEARYTGELDRGVVVVNHLARRGRRLGSDVVEAVRGRVPLDLIGMAAEELGGVGEIPPPELAAAIGRYRFFFNPIRYTSLPLALCEAMAVGLPIVALATTEVVMAVEHGVSGFLGTDVRELVAAMERLLRDPELAASMGAAARRRARQRYGIDRFVADWLAVLARATGLAAPPPSSQSVRRELAVAARSNASSSAVPATTGDRRTAIPTSNSGRDAPSAATAPASVHTSRPPR